jgi:ketosteroid isomerase-like protein
MTDRERITRIYEDMYTAMVQKNFSVLETVLADSFVLIHMTGMRQSKRAFIRAVQGGTLNYYSATHESIDISFSTDGNRALLDGKSMVSAAVFGGGKNTWRLRQKISLEKQDGEWKITLSEASTY